MKVAARWVYLYRAIDQYGQVIDVLVSEKRDMAATRRFLTQVLDHGTHPNEVTTDRAPAYPGVLDELVPAACHITEQYANNRHCCIKVKGVLAMHQSRRGRPLSRAENRNKPGIRRPATWLLGGQVDQFGCTEPSMQL